MYFFSNLTLFNLASNGTPNSSPTVLPSWSRKKWKLGRRSRRRRCAHRTCSVWSKRTRSVRRRSYISRCKSRRGKLSIVSRSRWWSNSDKMSPKRLRTQSCCIKKKKPSKASSSQSSTRTNIESKTTTWYKKRWWRTRSRSSKRKSRRRRWMNIADRSTSRPARTSPRKSQRKRRSFGRKRQRSCRWRCWKWSWLRSCRTLKPYRNKHIQNSKQQ